MIDSASLKIDYATGRIRELENLIQNNPPFLYVLETDTQLGERATLAKRNLNVIQQVALISGDIVHCLRAALDHVYWEIVSPHASNEAEKRQVQFPFCELEAHLLPQIKKRLANRVGQNFCTTLINLRPFYEGGNSLLCLINAMDVADKHRTLMPLGDYKTFSSSTMRKVIPDFPAGLVDCSVGMNGRDIAWVSPWLRMSIFPPFVTKFETRIDYPVDVVFSFAKPQYHGSVILTLDMMAATARNAVEALRAAVR